MQTQITKGELIIETKGKVGTGRVTEITPTQYQFDNDYQGLTTGAYSAMCNGTMKSFVRDDNTLDWESREIQYTKDGELVTITGHGTGKLGITEGAGKVEGEVVFATRSPKLSFLNNRKGRVEATVRGDETTGEIHMKIFAL